MLMKRTQIYLPQDLYAQLKALARLEKTSVSQVVRKKLTTEVRKKKNGTSVLLDLVKLGKKWNIKAPPDLSSNLD